nr:MULTISPECIES: cation:dicarboxylase symporter family transporter [unclassified Caballeronia]
MGSPCRTRQSRIWHTRNSASDSFPPPLPVRNFIAPLAFCSLVIGVKKIGDVRAVGRIGFRTLAWFVFASFVSAYFSLLAEMFLRLAS